MNNPALVVACLAAVAGLFWLLTHLEPPRHP